MPIIHPPGSHSVYVRLPAGVFDLVVTWPGRARVEVVHLRDTTFNSARTVIDFAGQASVVERRALARVASETPQWVFFRSSGVLDSNARLSVQVIPANLTVEA